MSNGGTDVANLSGSSGDDTFTAYATPRGGSAGFSRLAGPGYTIEVTKYNEVYANLLTGNDRANLYDGSANDYFWAKLGAAVLTDGTVDDATGDLVTASTYYYRVYWFHSAASDHVDVDGTQGGMNKKHVLYPLDYVLTMTGVWNDQRSWSGAPGIHAPTPPGAMTDLMNNLTEAKQAAEANLIVRREEMAATRR